VVNVLDDQKRIFLSSERSIWMATDVKLQEREKRQLCIRRVLAIRLSNEQQVRDDSTEERSLSGENAKGKTDYHIVNFPPMTLQETRMLRLVSSHETSLTASSILLIDCFFFYSAYFTYLPASNLARFLAYLALIT
jgi:hypothetical protein